MAISLDDPKTVAEFAKAIGADYALLSDEKREVAKLYGVLDPGGQYARRTTFVVDRDGVVQKIDEGSAALDPAGVITFCGLHKKS
jgi:peroxiredoxin